MLSFTFNCSSKKGRSVSFMFGRIGAPAYDKRFGTELHFDPNLLLDAAFYARENGAKYLRRVPISKIESLLTSFITENYYCLTEGEIFHDFENSYEEYLSDRSKEAFCALLYKSSIFNEVVSLYTFPIQTVDVLSDYYSESFSIVKPDSLLNVKTTVDLSIFDIKPSLYPPSERSTNRHYPFKSWLCVNAASIYEANKMKAAILSCLSLKYKDSIRRQFNQVDHMGGHCCFSDDEMSFQFGVAHTPSVLQSLKLNGADHECLNILSGLFLSRTDTDFRKLRALEYFYRSWFLEESERFPFLFMSLESMFGDGRNANQSVLNGLFSLFGDTLDLQRVRLMAELRGSIVHGGAPEIYDSRKYAKYYKKFSVCPSKDLDLLVAESIRVFVFFEKLCRQQDENHEVIEQAVKSGRINAYNDKSIFSESKIK